jgi:hypothetical protein
MRDGKGRWDGVVWRVKVRVRGDMQGTDEELREVRVETQTASLKPLQPSRLPNNRYIRTIRTSKQQLRKDNQHIQTISTHLS